MAYPEACRHNILIPAEAKGLPREGELAFCKSALSASVALLLPSPIALGPALRCAALRCAVLCCAVLLCFVVLIGMHHGYVALADVYHTEGSEQFMCCLSIAWLAYMS